MTVIWNEIHKNVKYYHMICDKLWITLLVCLNSINTQIRINALSQKRKTPNGQNVRLAECQNGKKPDTQNAKCHCQEQASTQHQERNWHRGPDVNFLWDHHFESAIIKKIQVVEPYRTTKFYSLPVQTAQGAVQYHTSYSLVLRIWRYDNLALLLIFVCFLFATH